MASCIFQMCFAGLVLLISESKTQAKTIQYNLSPNGKDITGCGNSSNPCKTLHYVLSNKSSALLSFTELKISPGKYVLRKTYSFTHLNNFSITGVTSTSSNVEIICISNASLAFFNSTNIMLSSIALKGCADWHSSTRIDKESFQTDYIYFLVAIQMRYCTSVTLKKVDILDSPGLAVNMIDIFGTLKIQDCLFGFNFPRENTTAPTNAGLTKMEFTWAGGGVFLKLTKYGSYNGSSDSIEHNIKTSGNKYLIENCRFLGNEAPRSGPEDPTETPDSPFSRGGGLAVIFKGDSRNNVVNIRSCIFSENKADWGGGLNVEFADISQNDSLFISNTTFESNFAHFAGGGARIGSDNPIISQSLVPHNLFVENCIFTNNTSMWGGGLAIYGATRRVGPNLLNSTANNALFKNCFWIRNKGTVGSAIGAYLKNLNRDGIGPSVPYHLELNNCSVIGNKAIVLGDEVNIGHGAIYSVRVPMILRGDTMISNNSHSAMALDSSTVDIRDRVTFSGNKGYRGGAVAMYGSTRFVLYKNSKLSFQENRCEEKGGAMYVASPGPIYVHFKAIGSNLHHCFFSYEEPDVDFEHWQTEIVFVGNQAFAVETGMSLYASTLVNCRRVGEKRDNNSALEWGIVKFIDKSGNKSTVQREVSTDPVDIKLNSADWNVPPGQKFNASAELIDEKGNVVFGILKVAPKSTEGSEVELGTPSSMFLSNKGHSLRNIWLIGKTHTNYSVKMTAFSGPQVTKKIKNVQLQSCNYGFRWLNSRCVCNSDIDDGVVYCKGKRVYLRQGFWGGVVDKKFVTHLCPEGYCKCPSDESSLGGACLFKPGGMCIDSRDGNSILCGRCKKGYSAVIGSAKCVPSCNNWWLILKIIVSGLLLTTLIIVVMALNVDAFTSYLNAFLYSYQVMPLLKADTMQFDPFIAFLTGIVNLQIKVEPSSFSCFASGMNEADKLMTMYLVPAYAIAFVSILSYIVRNHAEGFYNGKWRKCCKGFNCFGLFPKQDERSNEENRKWFKNPIHTICTIMVFCYTTITGISLKLLNFSNVGGRKVLFLEGQLKFFGHWKHILYGIFALVLLVLIAIFTVFLIFTPYFKNFFIVRKLLPFFQVFQGCFKDNYRYFAAFYFICRLLLVFFATFIPRGPAKRCVLDVFCILFLGVFLYFKPYNEVAKDDTEDDRCCIEVQVNKNSSKHVCSMKICCIGKSVEESTEEQRNEGQNRDGDKDDNKIKTKKRCKIHGKDHDYGWVNNSDALLLVNLCLISVISSQITHNVSRQSQEAMSAAVCVFGFTPILVFCYAIMRVLSKQYWNKLQSVEQKNNNKSANVELELQA